MKHRIQLAKPDKGTRMSIAAKTKNRRAPSGTRFIIFVLIPLFLIGTSAMALFFNQSHTLERETQKVEQSLHESAFELAYTFDTMLVGQYSVLETLANTLAVEDDLQADEITAHLVQAAKITDFAHFFYSGIDGAAHLDSRTIVDISGREYFHEVLSGHQSIQKINSSPASDRPSVALAVPLVRDGQVIGCMGAIFDEKTQRDLLLSRVYQGQGYSLICNEDGTVIIGTNNPDYLSSLENIFDFLSSATTENGTSNNSLESDLVAGQSGMLSYVYGDETYRMVYEPLSIKSASNKQWFIFSVVPDSVIKANVSETSNASLLMIGIIIVASLLSMGLIIALQRRTSRAIAQEREASRVSEEQFRIVAHQSGKFVYRYEVATKSTYRVEEMIDGFSMPQRNEDIPNSQRHLISDDSWEEFADMFARIDAGEPFVSVETLMCTSASEWRWFRSDATTIFDEMGKPVQAVIAYYDVTSEHEQAVLHEQNRHRAQTDSLTGVLNRTTFIERAEKLLTANSGACHAFVMMDVDNFKAVNDMLGHVAGDNALIEIVSRLTHVLRPSDIVGRVGGDEFCLCLNDIPSTEVVATRAKQICEALAFEVKADIPVSASLGIAISPDDGTSFEELYEKADTALYRAKSAGRNRFRFWQEG